MIPTRRNVLRLAMTGLAAGATSRAHADTVVQLPVPGGPSERAVTTAFPQKGAMILQRTRPPLLETPWEVFDRGVFTPNDQFYVRWHWAVIPQQVDAESYNLAVRGHVNTPLQLSLDDILAMPRVEMAAVNQCSGNSRGLFSPRVSGAQWTNGAMGNAKWTGVRLRDVLDRAGVKPGATAVRFNGLDEPVVPDGPDFTKSLDLDHARDGEVMIAFQMNGASLPLLNGFPIRLIVPGWYSTYWVKMLSDIEVLDAPDETYWMKTAYRIPDTPNANVHPGQTGFKTVPINRMNPRSFVTNLRDGAAAKPGTPLLVRGLAMGGDKGVKAVDVSTDAGASWQAAELGRDEGRYSFRQWQWTVPKPPPGDLRVMVRCTNTDGVAQPLDPAWNPGGFMRNVVEQISVKVA
jgi:DMSO/TMAO reductase YedYZ molybdopterin-dependent catalytic subunit